MHLVLGNMQSARSFISHFQNAQVLRGEEVLGQLGVPCDLFNFLFDFLNIQSTYIDMCSYLHKNYYFIIFLANENMTCFISSSFLDHIQTTLFLRQMNAIDI